MKLSAAAPHDANAPASPPARLDLADLYTPFVKWLGAEPLKAENGSSEVRLFLQPHHRNGWQVSHGGVLMTLLDVSMGMAARSAHPELQGSATVELKTSFVRPGKGAVLIARGTCYHRSTTMAFCEAEIVDEAGQLVAKGSGTFKYIKKRSAFVRDE